jgi:hypothetical protein
VPYFPQYSSATLVEYANYRSLTQASGVTAYSANSGDFFTNSVLAGDATAYVITLPSVALGGPVAVKMAGVPGNVSNTVTVAVLGADYAAGCRIGGTGGYGSVKLIHNAASGQLDGPLLILASDGTNWWIVSKAHSTVDTW